MIGSSGYTTVTSQSMRVYDYEFSTDMPHLDLLLIIMNNHLKVKVYSLGISFSIGRSCRALIQWMGT